MRLLRNCNSKHPLWLLHSHSLLDHTGMNNPLIYFFTVMHLPYAFISFLTQTEFQGQTFQSLSCIYPHLPHPSFVDWTSTLVKFVSAANVQALFLILSPQTVFKHLVSVLLFLWVPYLVTTQLLLLALVAFCSDSEKLEITDSASTRALTFVSYGCDQWLSTG